MRDVHLIRRRLAAVLLLALLSGPVMAQIVRTFPHGTEHGMIAFDAPPLVRVDGVRERLGPGVQVRDENNRAPLLHTLRGRSALANYQRDASGAIFRVWLLTPMELERLAPPQPVQQKNAPWYVN